MRPLLFLLSLLACGLAPLRGAELDTWLEEARVAEAKLDSARALELLERADAARPNDPVILQRIAKQYSDLVVDQPSMEEKKRYAQRALDYAKRAVALNPDDAVSVLSLAISHGKLAVYSDTRTKVSYSRLVKEEAERALVLKPDYAWAHHVLGRWHYEVAELSGAAKFLVKILYGGLPAASVEQAVLELKRATELEPDELNHWLELGFAYAAAGNNVEAASSWKRGLAMPTRGKHDEPSKRRAQEALAALK